MKFVKICLMVVLSWLTLSVSAQAPASAQPYQVKGRVVDGNGNPLVGATILAKSNTLNGVVSGAQGYFNITVAPNEVLIVSMISYETKEVPVRGRRTLVVEISESAEEIEAVVVVGYGEQQAKDVTGSITAVDMAAMEKMPSADINTALQGRMAGVVLSSNDGQPGEEMNLVIRGANSVTQSNSPLYVIDGFPTEDFDALDLNPNDIKSISILKDASAGAIYGSRGANGVVIIETKSGRGKTSVTYTGSVAVNEVANRYELMSPYEFLRYITDLSPEYGKGYLEDMGMVMDDYKSVEGYDWQSQIFRTALTHNHALTVSGGNDVTQYVFSGSYLNQEGIVVSTNYERFQGRLRLDHKISPKLTLGVNANYTYGETDGAIASEAGSSTSSWQSYLMYRVWSFSPLDKGILDSDEGDETTVDVTKLNPIISAKNTLRKVENRSFMGNISLKYQITPDLRFYS
ncbi:MAG: SusC/RagA family TonB-linked outer membrane protein, partial [Tidjanibacter sp.]|nr:SusC/RagA family TonB-linked outer membrane protein [Tidjanibacter sp.]